MSVDLVKEVLDNCPAGIDGSARLLLVVLAEMAKDEDRQGPDGKLIPARTCFPSQELLMKRTGIKSAAGLRAVYGKLAGFDLDPRIVLGTDRNGQMLFACNGRKTTFKVPRLAEAASAVAPSNGEGETTVAPSGHKGATTALGRRNHSCPLTVRNHKEPTPQPPSTRDRRRKA